jgi:hypothetical protein
MQTVRHTIKQLVQIAAISGALAAVVMSAMFAVNAIAFSQGQADVKATLQRSIEDKTIHATRPLAPYSLLPIRSGRGQHSPLSMHDCLIWTTIVAPGLDSKELSLRTIRIQWAKREINARAPSNPDCQAVLQVLEPNASAQAQPTNVPYDRYIMGQRALAQLLLSNLSFSASALVVHVTTYVAFFLALVLAWRRRATAVVVICAILLLFYGLSYYGGMLYFAPMDITHALFIIAALYMPLGAATVTACAIFGALYGALVAQFEILTGGVPVALALVALMAGSSAPDRPTFARNVSAVVTAFCLSFVCCFAIKLSVVSLVDGSNQFARHFPGLLHRLRGDIARETPPELAKQFVTYLEYPFGQIVYLVRIYQPWSRIIGWGSSTFGSILVVAGLVALAVATVRVAISRRRAGDRFPPQLMGCWLGLGFLIAWMALFWNHTLVHPFFMARFLVIPVMCGAVALVAMRANVRRAAGSTPAS